MIHSQPEVVIAPSHINICFLEVGSGIGDCENLCFAIKLLGIFYARKCSMHRDAWQGEKLLALPDTPEVFER
jgi:hypothetical protein